MVLDIDEERRRISLGLKQCKANPWQQFAETHNKGDRVEGKIKSITDFGIFIGPTAASTARFTCLTSPNVAGEEAVREYKKATKSLQLFCRLTQNVNVSPRALNSSQKIRSTTGLL